MPATVYLGTSAFAATILARLAGTPHRPALVVSRPDSPQGRGRRLTAPPVVAAARVLGLEVFQPETVNDADSLAKIESSGAEAAIVCAFGALIKDPLLSAFEILNVHPSLLPRWRGAAPIERAIMAGDAETGVSIMRLVAGLDSGPVCLENRTPIAPEDDYGSVAARLEALGADLLIQALEQQPAFVEQPETGVTYAEKITAEDRRLDPAAHTARELARTVAGLSPHIGAYLPVGDSERLGVWAARAPDSSSLADDDPRRIACAGASVLELLEVQPPGKRRMSAADWARGQNR